MFGGAFFHYLAVRFGWHQPQTQTSIAERDALRRHLSGRKRIVEIGVFEGFTTFFIAKHADPMAVIYGVDPFFAGRLGICWGLWTTIAHNRPHLRTGRVKLLRCLSTEVGTNVPADVDFVFIDGDHSLDGIRSDWEFWSARIGRGGIIALHDTIRPPAPAHVPELGSHIYFERVIRHDANFVVVEEKDSLSVLQKL